MKNKLVAFIFGCVAATSTLASDWHLALIRDDEKLHFFDAETIEKHKDKAILVWTKSVQTAKPNSMGFWSTTIRWKFQCTKRTVQLFIWSGYDQDGKFIKSGSTPGAEDAAIPDSIGEAMLNIFCEPSFPNDKSGKSYSKIEDNDPIMATKRFIEYKNRPVDPAPQ